MDSQIKTPAAADVSQRTAASEEITGDQKLMAMFSHLSIFFGSLFIPFVFWIIYREKSKFVSFHSLQSLFFHVVYVVIIIFIALVFGVIGTLVGFFKEGGARNSSPDVFMIVIMSATGLLVAGFVLASFAFAIYLSISAYKGETKKYPIVGNFVYKKIYGGN